MIKRWTFLVILVLAIGCTESAFAFKVLPPQEGIYHSAHPDFGLQDDEVSQESVRDFIQLAGKKIVWAYFSDHWEKGIFFPERACRILNENGIVPLVGIMPWSTLVQNKAEPHYTLEKLLAGEFDRELYQYASVAASLPFPIMVEFGPEANGSWFPWSAAWNGRGVSVDYGNITHPDGAERFRDAYRHIVSIFRRAGANNVTWVFHVAARYWPLDEWNSIRHYYPGDEWVDWIGVSVYGRLRPGKTYSFTSIMDAVYPKLLSVSSTKPFAVLELGISENKGVEDKASWIRSAYASLESGRYPRVKAVAWWNKVYRPDQTRSFLEIDSTPSSLEAYRDAVAPLVEEPRFSKEDHAQAEIVKPN